MINNSIDQPLLDIIAYVEENGNFDRSKLLFVQ